MRAILLLFTAIVSVSLAAADPAATLTRKGYWKVEAPAGVLDANFSAEHTALARALTESAACGGCEVRLLYPEFTVRLAVPNASPPTAPVLDPIVVEPEVPPPAVAFDVTFELEPPTQREDGSALAPADLQRYTLTVHNGSTVERSVDLDPTDPTIAMTLPAGLYTATAVAVDRQGLASQPSNSVAFSVPLP